MRYQQLGQTELKVSRLCLGTMTMGWTSNREESWAVLNHAFEHGINFLDTADIYSFWAEGNPGGVAETWLGEWLTERKLKNKVVIATKVRGRMWPGPDGEGLSRGHLMRAVDDSLRRLKVDVIDLYQSHWADENTPIEETMRAFEEMIKQGKVRYIGCSNHSSKQLRDSLDLCRKLGLPRYETLQPHYNLVHRAEYETELMEICAKERLGVIPYSPLAGGFLTGKYKRQERVPNNSRGYGNDRMKAYMNDKGFALIEQLQELAVMHRTSPAAVALAWLLANPTISSVIIGANRVEQLTEAIGAAELALPSEHLTRLSDLPSPS